MTLKKKVYAYQSVGFRYQKQKKTKQMVSPQNGDTRGGPPPPSDATEKSKTNGITATFNTLKYLSSMTLLALSCMADYFY